MSAPAADLLAPGAPTALVLCGARVGGLLLVAPVLSSRTVPMPLRAALLVILTWLLLPASLGGMAAGAELSPATALSETLIGFAIGLGAAVFVAAAEAMGELLAIQIGLAGAASLDPITHQSSPVLGQFVNLFAVAVLLSLNAHLLMIDAVGDSLRYLPLGGRIDAVGGMAAMVGAGGMVFLLGLQFAAPVVATVLLANVALAVLSRAAPQLNILAVAFPLQIGIGLLALAASLPLVGAFFTGWESAYDGVLTHLLGALAGGER